jgi:hypothetical protein
MFPSAKQLKSGDPNKLSVDPIRMVEDLSWIEQALLIYGPRKGGTTLYQNLLDGGAEVFVYPAELKLKYLARTPVLAATDYHALVKLPTNKPKDMNDIGRGDRWNPQAYFVHTREHTVSSSQFDRAGYDADWSNDESGESPVGDLVRKDIVRVYRNCPVRLKPPRMWCAKEVGGRPSTVLNLWKQIFPEGRLLLLARDPLMVVRAVLKDRRMVGERPSIWNIMKQTYEPMAVNASIAEHLNSDRTFALCYEDLVKDTPGSMKALARFLGIDYGTFLTEPTILGQKVVVRTSSRVDQEVFVSDARWTDGLTLRERAIISVTSCILRLRPRFWRSYDGIRNLISAANASEIRQ